MIGTEKFFNMKIWTGRERSRRKQVKKKMKLLKKGSEGWGRWDHRTIIKGN